MLNSRPGFSFFSHLRIYSIFKHSDYHFCAKATEKDDHGFFVARRSGRYVKLQMLNLTHIHRRASAMKAIPFFVFH
jgi:hypothetical protein